LGASHGRKDSRRPERIGGPRPDRDIGGNRGFRPEAGFAQDGLFWYPVGSEPGAACGSTVYRLSLRPLLPDEDA